MNQEIDNDRMAQFIDMICDQLKTSMHDRASDMLKAWHENIEEAHEEQKGFPPLKLCLSASVDLEACRIETSVGFVAKYQSRLSMPIEDPNQAKLPL